jgi:hypothetical protein
MSLVGKILCSCYAYILGLYSAVEQRTAVCIRWEYQESCGDDQGSSKGNAA